MDSTVIRVMAAVLAFLAASAGEAGDFRLMSYNIRHCQGRDRKVDIRRTADAIMRENPDFVGLNEVDRCVKRSGGVDEAAELGRLTGLHATFAEAIPYKGGIYGNAVLSREKPISVERVPLPGKEKRLLLLCEFANFWFGTTHLDFGTNQLKSVEIIRGVVAEKSATKPVFLTGDWNATPESATLAAMKEFMTVLSNERCRTFHGFKSHPPESEYCIDYIAVDSRHAAEVVVTETHATPDVVTSDHNPVFVSVRLSALVATAAGGWRQMPGMKTEWGEKVTPENAWREYPRPQMVRAGWTNLNGLWQYAVTKGAPGFPAKWNGEILVPFVVESSLSGVGRLIEPDETLWYRRSFDADVKPGERLILHFEQADFRAMVYVNGREIDVPHEGGQMPFSYDVTGFVKKGANELVVAVWDPTASFIGSSGKQSFKPKGCFYTRSTGIGGTVWLETVPGAYIANYKVTPDIDKGSVRFEFDVAGGFAKPEVEVTVEGKTTKTSNGVAEVKMPAGFEMWSPESPKLYDFTAKYGKDEVKGYFGMRKIEVRKDANGVLRIFFNNKPRFLVGTLDQGWWPDGLLTPPSDEAMAYDIRKLKEMGYDMMRKHIKVEPRRYYYLCDRLGIIVMQDMPSGAGDRTQRYGFYRRELKEMIDHLYNAPSIVSWIPYNENWGQPGEFLTHATLVWTQRYDPSRIVDGPSGWHDYEGGNKGPHKPAGVEEAADLVDRHDYGARPGMWPVNDRRASFLGEFGGIGCRVDGHLWTEKAWGYGDTGKDTDRKAVQGKFVSLMDHVAGLAMNGLAGSVYTQTTDVEGEINGLMTYDRKVVKFDEKALAEVHGRVRKAAELGVMPRVTKNVFPRLDPDPLAWAYTTKEPTAGWEKPGFDDSAWARRSADSARILSSGASCSGSGTTRFS